MKRLLTSAVLLLCTLLSFAQFTGSGSGTESDPYLILNPAQLNQMRNFLGRKVYFKLMADIDLTAFIEDEYPTEGWLPVGTQSAPFKGILDGNDKTISGLWIVRRNINNVGLMGYCVDATIMNLSINNCSIFGNQNVGALIGFCEGALNISNCNLSGAVEGNANVGGCIGYKAGYTNSEINSIFSTVVVSGGDQTGGIAGYTYYINISNCFVSSTIRGNNRVGGITGRFYWKGMISFCSFIGEVISSTGDDIGGIQGYGDGDVRNLNNCFVNASICGRNNVGGLTGNSQMVPTNCYVYGTVSGQENVGGLIGNSLISSAAMYNYFNGNVFGTNNVGGLHGPDYNGSWQNCVAMASFIKATGSRVGRIGSTSFYTSTSDNKSFNRTIVISEGVEQEVLDSPRDGTGVSKNTLRLAATYIAMGWDFTDTWTILETESFPYFKWQTAPPIITSQVVAGATTVSGRCVDGGVITLLIDGEKQEIVSNGTQFEFTVSPLQAGHEIRVGAKAEGKWPSYYTTETVAYLGSGIEDDPYQVYTATDLTGVYRKGYFKLMNDIDLTDYINQFNPTEGWEPIGREGSQTIYFDGDNHTISGLWCNTTSENTGLFSFFADGYIKNVTVTTAEGKQVKGGSNTGILIGKMINGTIENCRVSGTLGDGTPVGGLIGLLEGGNISKCKSSVTITTTEGNTYVGGLVGEITSGEIEQCHTTGTLTGSGTESYVGGLVGKNSATVSDCYSDAVIHSSYNAAGLIAYNYGLVEKCYATGNLYSNNYAAGIIGYNDGTNAIVRNCVALNEYIELAFESQQVQQGGGYGQRIIGGIKNSAPAPEMNNYALNATQLSVNGVAQRIYDDIMNGVAKTADELMTESTYTSLSWDFNDIWGIDEGLDNPRLNWDSDTNPTSILATNVSLNQTNITLTSIGETFALTASVEPANVTDGSVTWASSDETFATVSSEGVVTAVANGMATITASTNDGTNLTASCTVTVAIPEDDPDPDTDISQIDNVVYMESTDVSAGSEETLSIKMKNTVGIQTLQFDLYLPEGVEVLTDEDDFELIDLSTERTTARKMDQFSVQRMSNGAYRVLINSSRGYTFDGTDGEIATVQVGISETMTPGNYPVVFRDIVLVNTSSVGYETDYVKCSLNIPDYKPGDVNNDTKVNAIDLNAITNYILERRDFPFTFNKKAANINGDKETNGDEKINAIDLNAVTNMILNQGATTSGANRRRFILIPD